MDPDTLNEDEDDYGATMKTNVNEVHDTLSVLTVDNVEKRIDKMPGVESAIGIRKSWVYSDLMPLISGIGFGLSPAFQ